MSEQQTLFPVGVRVIATDRSGESLVGRVRRLPDSEIRYEYQREMVLVEPAQPAYDGEMYWYEPEEVRLFGLPPIEELWA